MDSDTHAIGDVKFWSKCDPFSYKAQIQRDILIAILYCRTSYANPSFEGRISAYDLRYLVCAFWTIFCFSAAGHTRRRLQILYSRHSMPEYIVALNFRLASIFPPVDSSFVALTNDYTIAVLKRPHRVSRRGILTTLSLKLRRRSASTLLAIHA